MTITVQIFDTGSIALSMRLSVPTRAIVVCSVRIEVTGVNIIAPLYFIFITNFITIDVSQTVAVAIFTRLGIDASTIIICRERIMITSCGINASRHLIFITHFICISVVQTNARAILIDKIQINITNVLMRVESQISIFVWSCDHPLAVSSVSFS
jgi:hypothetical protein